MASSGDEVARAVAATLRVGEGPTSLFDIRLDGIGEGWATASLEVTPHTLNGYGNAHGGILFLLADTTFAYACNSTNVATVAQAASITFLAPGIAGERITADAREAASIGRSGVFDVRLTGADGRTIAIFQGMSRSLGKPVLPHSSGETHNG